MHKSFQYGLIIGLFALSGCHLGLLEKAESERNCPTDIRQTVPWCFGEDAIFYCPCRPGEDFHGHKPTCWKMWPTSGAEWRDVYCGQPTHACQPSADITYPQHTEIRATDQYQTIEQLEVVPSGPSNSSEALPNVPTLKFDDATSLMRRDNYESNLHGQKRPIDIALNYKQSSQPPNPFK